MIAFFRIALTDFVIAGDQPDNARFVRQRRGKVRAAWAIKRNERAIQRGGDMHQAGVIADHGLAVRQQNDRLLQFGFASQIVAVLPRRFLQALQDLLAGLFVFSRAKQRNLIAAVDQLLRQRGIVIVRPALGRPEFRAGTEADKRPFRAQIEGGGGFLLSCSLTSSFGQSSGCGRSLALCALS